jgi:hypothetical protein
VRGIGILGSSAKRSSKKFGRFLGALRRFVPWRTYIPLRKEYGAFVTWPTDAA